MCIYMYVYIYDGVYDKMTTTDEKLKRTSFFWSLLQFNEPN